MGPIRPLRKLGNILGLAWWAKIETSEPEATYWFGPFLTRRSLTTQMKIFQDDLNREGVKSINHSIIRGRRSEPLTI